MDRPSTMGPTNGNTSKQKVMAADAVPGLCMMLAYQLGGYDFFPAGICTRDYILEANLSGRSVLLTVSQFNQLYNDLFARIGRTAGQLSAGSMSIYFHMLRNGLRINRNGQLPAIRNTYASSTGTLQIWPKSYLDDKAEGIASLIPDWVQKLGPPVATKEQNDQP